METTTELITPTHDLRITKRERYDPDVMDALLRDTERFSANDLRRLGAYKKHRENGNEVEVVYHYGKGWAEHGLGRLYALDNKGLQSFPFDIRNPLLAKHYWDLDMANCHYVIIAKLGDDWGLKTDSIRYYINNRDKALSMVSSNRSVAKTAYLKIAYGGNIKLYNEHYRETGEYSPDNIPADADLTLVRAIEKEVTNIVRMCWGKFPQYQKTAIKSAKAKNPPGKPEYTLLAAILQDEERKCLLSLDKWLHSRGRHMDIYIHDGGEIRKEAGEKEFPLELIRGGEKAIREATGYDHSLVVKPFKHAFNPIVEKTVLYDDCYAAKQFISLMGPNIQREKETVLFFDNDTGMWGSSDTMFRANVVKHAANLVFKDGDTVYNYGGVERNVANFRKFLTACLRDTNFMTANADSANGKLLFADGIYDFNTDSFTEGFDPTVVFYRRNNRPYPRSADPELVRKVNKVLFEDAFDTVNGRPIGSYYKKVLTKGLYGDYTVKKFYFGLGEPNCGKGLTVLAVSSAFGDYIAEFNGNNLKYNARNGADEAKQLSWILPFQGARLAFANELRMDKVPIDGNLLKALSSGGDKMGARGNYKDESFYINRTTMFILANDLLPLNPEDNATRSRKKVLRWPLHFVEDEPSQPDQRKADPSVKEWFKREDVKDAVFHAIRECWLNEMDDEERLWGKGIKEPAGVVEETKEWCVNGEDNFKEILEREYEITNDENDYVATEELAKYLKKNGYDAMSDNKLGRLLTKLMPDMPSSVVRNKKKVRLGIKPREDC